MLNKEDAGNKRFRFLNNLKNCCWLTGYIFNLSEDRKSFYIRQSNYATHLFLIELDANDYLSATFKEGSGIKLYARIASKEVCGLNSVVLKPLFVEKPSLDELPSVDNYTKNKTQSTELFNPYTEFGLDKPSGKALNTVIIAGFMESLVFATNPKGEIKPDCLLLGLRVGKDMLIPVRIYGQRCTVQYQQVKKMRNHGKYSPLAFHSQLKSKHVVDEDGKNHIVTYIFADKIRFMDQSSINEYFLGKPLWLHDLIKTEDPAE